MYRFVFFILFAFLNNSLFCQNVSTDMSFDKELSVLKNKFYLMDSIDKVNFSHSYLSKAKQNKDAIKTANGYYFLSELTSREKQSIQYCDSIIQITQNLNHIEYPALGYIQKGIQLYYNKKYNDALEFFLKANDIAIKKNNTYQQIIIKHYIASLKDTSNKISEALEIYQSNYDYIIDNKLEHIDRRQYFKSLYALANCYARDKVFDTAKIYYNKGLKDSNGNVDFLYPYFLTGYGISCYEEKNYSVAIDSLKKGCRLSKKDVSSVSAMYLYIYMSYRDLEKPKDGLSYLLKIDSIYKKYPLVRRYAKDAFTYLNSYYKENNDQTKQLNYLTKLIKVDSLIKDKDGDLYTEIVKKYDTPNLVSQKEALIASLEEKSNTSEKVTITLIFLSLCIFLVCIYALRRHYILKKRFDRIIQQIKDKPQPQPKNNLSQEFDSSKTESITENKPIIKAESIGISEDLINKILNSLEKFEASQRFLKKKYTLNSLAKEINTNSSYLSKVINLEKDTNFANYLNNLRLDYAIERLTTDYKFRLYTIKAISEESGFNNQQTFSIAFHKKTKLSPSYFIKQLNS